MTDTYHAQHNMYNALINKQRTTYNTNVHATHTTHTYRRTANNNKHTMDITQQTANHKQYNKKGQYYITTGGTAHQHPPTTGIP